MINTAPGNLTEEEIERANQEEARRWSQILLEPQWTYPESMILNVPHHIQQETYWCGPASVLAMIDYNGRVAQVSGTSEYEKQNTIAIQSGTTTSGSNTLYLRNTLNNYVGDLHFFNVKRIDSWEKHYDVFWAMIESNIFNAHQPLLVAVNSKYLPYYGGRVSYHYVVVDGMTKQIDDSGQPIKSISTVRVVDPHYDSSYTGYHTVYYEELLRAAVGFWESATQEYNVAY